MKIMVLGCVDLPLPSYGVLISCRTSKRTEKPKRLTKLKLRSSKQNSRLPKYVCILKYRTIEIRQLTPQDNLSEVEKRYSLENRLILSAWQDLGARTARDHLIQAMAASNHKRSGGVKAMPQGWLGRQRRYQEDAVYVGFILKSSYTPCIQLSDHRLDLLEAPLCEPHSTWSFCPWSVCILCIVTNYFQHTVCMNHS